MDKRGVVIALILLIQACGPLVAQTEAPAPPGLMQRLTERAKEVREKVQRVGGAVVGFAGTYYEDHLQPAASSYFQWASSWGKSLREMPPYIIESRCELRLTDNSLSERTVTRAAADMNAKITFAVFLALQVSLSLCEIPTPDAELMDKYNDLKNTFFRRLTNAYGKLTAAANANENTQAARDAITELQNREQVGVAMQVFKAVGEEMEPVVDRVRSAALGTYGTYLRPYIGEYLQDGITRAKAILDQVLPVEN
uniref:Apolipoprotein A-II n=1 Tax=Knipowitschia caucasica TaxID=637954 RepID=A0AAV2MAG8_KNICA